MHKLTVEQNDLSILVSESNIENSIVIEEIDLNSTAESSKIELDLNNLDIVSIDNLTYNIKQ